MGLIRGNFVGFNEGAFVGVGSDFVNTRDVEVFPNFSDKVVD